VEEEPGRDRVIETLDREVPEEWTGVRSGWPAGTEAGDQGAREPGQPTAPSLVQLGEGRSDGVSEESLSDTGADPGTVKRKKAELNETVGRLSC
jgi:hypothetical protein